MNALTRWLRAHNGRPPRMVRLTDPIEIESARMNGLQDICGFEHEGAWWGYEYSVLRWRQRVTAVPSDE